MGSRLYSVGRTKHFRTAIINRCSSASRVCASIARKYMRRIAARSARQKRSGSSRVGSRSMLPPTRVSPHEKSAGRTSKVETYREILNLTPQRSTAARWLRKGGLVVAAGYLARWGWQIAAHHNRPTSTGAARKHRIIVKAIQLPLDSLTRLTSPRSATGAHPAASRRNRLLRLLSIGRCEGEQIV